MTAEVIYVSREEFNERARFRRCLKEIEEILSKPFNPQTYRQLILNNKEFYASNPGEAVHDAMACTDDELLQQYNVLKNS